MADVKEKFPFTPLEPQEITEIHRLCGVQPPEHPDPDPSGFRAFLEASGFAALSEEWLRTYMRTLGKECLEAYDVPVNDESRRDLYRGMLFYGGVAREVGGIPSIRCSNDVLYKNREADKLCLTLDALQGINTQGRMCSALAWLISVHGDADTHDRVEVAKIGAGLVHGLLTDSVLAKPTDFTPRHHEAERIQDFVRIKSLDFDVDVPEVTLGAAADPTGIGKDVIWYVQDTQEAAPAPSLPRIGTVDNRAVRSEGLLK